MQDDNAGELEPSQPMRNGVRWCTIVYYRAVDLAF